MPGPTDNINLSLNLKSAASQQQCDWPDCPDKGEFRAPKDREHLTDYYWFCKPHIREYNAKWNYFDGMTAQQIYDHQKRDVFWHRPTWKMGQGPQMGPKMADGTISDLHDLFGEDGPRNRPQGTGHAPLDRDDLYALDCLGLDETATMHDIKETYKRLVKKYHPDTNGGHRTYENKFKKVSLAYQQLLKHKHKFN